MQETEDYLGSGLLCAYCSKPADGPMLEMLGPHAHVKCVLREVGKLLDPEGPHSLYNLVWSFAWFSRAGTPLGRITWDECLER